MFVQIHTLTPYAAASPNCDEHGGLKRVPLGEVARPMLSSQKQKRVWRKHDGPEGLHGLVEQGTRASRIFRLEIAEPLLEQGFAPRLVARVLLPFQDILTGRSKRKAKELDELVGKARDPLETLTRDEKLFMSPAEVAHLRDEAAAILSLTTDEKEAAELVAERVRDTRRNLLAMRLECDSDIALFGRMTTGDSRARLDGALHVAHAIGVHPMESRHDFYTSCDDLEPGRDRGQIYLNSNEINSPILYGYAVLDIRQLFCNTQGLPRKRWREGDPTLPGAIAERLIGMIPTVSTAARKASTGAFAKAGFVLVEVGEAQPRQLTEAFREPVPPLMPAAVAALLRELEACDAMFESGETRWYADGSRRVAPPGAVRASLPRIAAAVRGLITAACRPNEAEAGHAGAAAAA